MLNALRIEVEERDATMHDASIVSRPDASRVDIRHVMLHVGSLMFGMFK